MNYTKYFIEYQYKKIKVGDLMQCNDVKAFRQRLVRAGFTDICIFDCYNGLYHVYCTSSDGKRISKKMSIEEIRNTPRVVWFD